MEKSFEIVNIREIVSKINTTASEDRVSSSYSSAYLLVFQYNPTDDSVGVHAFLRYLLEDNSVVLENGFTFIAKIKDWLSADKSDDAIKSNPFVKKLIEYCMAFVSGAALKNSIGTPLNNIIVPFEDAEVLLNNIYIEDITKKE